MDHVEASATGYFYYQLGGKVGLQPNKESVTTAVSVDREWLCRYPLPRNVVHDQGFELTSEEF